MRQYTNETYDTKLTRVLLKCCFFPVSTFDVVTYPNYLYVNVQHLTYLTSIELFGIFKLMFRIFFQFCLLSCLPEDTRANYIYINLEAVISEQICLLQSY